MFNTFWSSEHAEWKIHIKEALIVLKSLEKYGEKLRGKHIHLMTDNMAVYHSSRYGSSNPLLNDLVLKIAHKAYDLGAEITFFYVNTKEQLADEPSRKLGLGIA